MTRARHLEITLKSATDINAYTFGWKSRTKIHANLSFKNMCYTSEIVEDMGQNPIWEDNRSNIFHFDFDAVTDRDDHVLLELFNRNNVCIGTSQLCLAELLHLMPEHVPELKTLPVMAKTPKQYGNVVLLTQIKAYQVMAKLGLLKVELQKGNCKNITKFYSKKAELYAKLIYKNTTYTSGTLKNMGNKFVWQSENSFVFVIDSWEPDDRILIHIFNFEDLVGECMVLVSLTEATFPVFPKTEQLYIRAKAIGQLVLTTTFKPAHQNSHDKIRSSRRMSFDSVASASTSTSFQPSAPEFRPGQHQRSPRESLGNQTYGIQDYQVHDEEMEAYKAVYCPPPSTDFDCVQFN